MAGKLESLRMEAPDVVEEAEEAEGQTKSLKMTEDLLAMVKKLQKEGSLEPQIEDLINRINELQQAKKKSSEELGEAQALWETLHRELDSLNEEKVHLEEVLNKKQEALRILQLYCQRKESGANRLHVEEQLENLMGQHKELWEFHMLKQRLAWEIRALQSSREQLLTEGGGRWGPVGPGGGRRARGSRRGPDAPAARREPGPGQAGGRGAAAELGARGPGRPGGGRRVRAAGSPG
ncbi:synaptonemal complex central element protein 1-like [Vulpes lagopus]|uniref:synaptonemal complex central element protein 1-like n=1 Tax=Vulpes lagopus TaxID=494514 RepID=UPI001BC919E3|nr:synaptonemal complex central element protein 1-like [Vulpes lagopus]